MVWHDSPDLDGTLDHGGVLAQNRTVAIPLLR